MRKHHARAPRLRAPSPGTASACSTPSPRQRIRGISDAGAVLVRPDGHVAWRADTAGEEQLQALRTAIAGLLGHDAARTVPEDRLETVAG